MSAQYTPYRDEDSVDGLEATSWTNNEPGSVRIYGKTTEKKPGKNNLLMWQIIPTILIVGIFCFFLGYENQHCPEDSTQPVSCDKELFEHPMIKEKLLEEFDKQNILNMLEQYEDTDRLPGSDSDHEFAAHVKQLFQQYDFDTVTLRNYTFKTMLPKKPTVVRLLNKENKTLYSSIEDESYPHDDMRPFLPLSQAEHIVITTNQILYLNKGLKEDYARLTNLGVNANETEGKVVIIRQSFYQAHDVVITAQESGARAILLFPDPEVYGADSPFPKSIQLKNDAGRSHPLAWSNYGDLVSFNMSNLNGIDTSKFGFDKENKVNIPVIPISFNTAQRILRGLAGAQAPKEWNCFEFTLYIGPGYREENNEEQRYKIQIEFYNDETTVTTATVTGIIVGRVEPDRYVVIGSRRDSLNRGLLDSISGTAVMLEIARVYGHQLKQGWRPRRTIVFNSFGSESLNLIGSSHWLEYNQRLLHSRAVAYLNCDLVITGNHTATIAASPLLYQVVYNATRVVRNPNFHQDLHTVYDAWKDAHHTTKTDEVSKELMDVSLDKLINDINKMPPSLKPDSRDPIAGLREFWMSATVKMRPKMRRLDLQSIYSPFFLYAGIPVVDVRYSGFSNNQTGRAPLTEDMLPMIGTKYDNLAAILHIDPHLKYHVTVAKILSEILRDLSDSVYLPFNLLDYAATLRDSYEHFVANYGKTFEESNVELGEYWNRYFRSLKTIITIAIFMYYILLILSPSNRILEASHLKLLVSGI